MTTNRSRTLAVLAVASASLSLLVAAPAAAAPGVTYAPCTPTALPMFPGGTGGEVMWINNNGLYVGGSENAQLHQDGTHLFQGAYWTHDAGGYHIHALPNDPLIDDEVLDVNLSGRMVDYGVNPTTGNFESYVFDLASNTWWHLPGVGGSDTRGRRINASGVVAGSGNTSNGKRAALTWAPPYTVATKLPSQGQYPIAPGINDSGVTVGLSARQRFNPSWDDAIQHQGAHAYFPLGLPNEWLPDGTPIHLPVLATQAEPFAINNAGTIVGGGDVSITTNQWDAVYWRNGVIHDMGGLDDPNSFTEARGLSQGGWAVGGSQTDTGGQAFIWTGAGTLQYLPALDGIDGGSNSHAVNDVLRQAGGWSEDGTGNAPPTVWQCPDGFTTG